MLNFLQGLSCAGREWIFMLYRGVSVSSNCSFLKIHFHKYRDCQIVIFCIISIFSQRQSTFLPPYFNFTLSFDFLCIYLFSFISSYFLLSFSLLSHISVFSTLGVMHVEMVESTSIFNFFKPISKAFCLLLV